ncbi:hypothetical protein CI105_00215 [Candidatus Izimaplasma bacterium ZiA1]|nr:hypothetical protein CI105_00215 [Candidatus Izimaplasma bacterium ZiA1]
MDKDKKLLIKLFGVVSMFLYEALAAMGIGYLIGLGLDKLFGFEMLFKAIFLVIGILAAVRNLIVKALKLGEELDE